MNSYTEAAGFQRFSYLGVALITFRDEIKTGFKSKLALQIHKIKNILVAVCSVHIVHENKSELFTVRPASPAFGRIRGFWMYGPNISVKPSPAPGHHSS
ncbi:MAG: hypothetical protein HPY46_10505 [Candidatus Aminicenantes bacterium]|nr:hypothetical protein [Candidatus Aminicenantes bacterium]